MPPRTLVFLYINYVITFMLVFKRVKNCLPKKESILFNPNLKQQYYNFVRMHKRLILIITESKSLHLYVTACYLCYVIDALLTSYLP